MFPQYEYTPAPDNHELYNCFDNLKGRPKFSIVSNGIRAM